MKKLLLLAILLIFSNSFVSGQSFSEKNVICSDKEIENISSRGIKIGADIKDILDIFASTDEEKNRILNSNSGQTRKNIGFEHFAANPKENDKRFEGISSYYFEFLDGKLVTLSVNYTKPEWKNINQFTETTAKILNLPDVKYWNAQNSMTNDIQCGDYKVRMSFTGSGSGLGIYNLKTKDILEQREQKLKEETREKDIKQFKP